MRSGNDTIENNHLEEVGFPFARSIEFYTSVKAATNWHGWLIALKTHRTNDSSDYCLMPQVGGHVIKRNRLKMDGAGGIGVTAVRFEQCRANNK